jgi:hypothetical protein
MTTTDTQRGAGGDLVRMLDQRRAMSAKQAYTMMPQETALLLLDIVGLAVQVMATGIDMGDTWECDINVADDLRSSLVHLNTQWRGAS